MREEPIRSEVVVNVPTMVVTGTEKLPDVAIQVLEGRFLHLGEPVDVVDEVTERVDARHGMSSLGLEPRVLNLLLSS